MNDSSLEKLFPLSERGLQIDKIPELKELRRHVPASALVDEFILETDNQKFLPSSPSLLKISGRLRIFKDDLEATLIIERLEGGLLQTMLCGAFSSGWNIKDGFGPLPKSWRTSTLGAGAQEYGETIFSDVELEAPIFIIADHNGRDEKGNLYSKGINLFGKLLTTSKILTAITEDLSVKGENLLIAGTVDLIKSSAIPLIHLTTQTIQIDPLKFVDSMPLSLTGYKICLDTQDDTHTGIETSVASIVYDGFISNDSEPLLLTLEQPLTDNETKHFLFQAENDDLSVENGIKAFSKLLGVEFDVELPDFFSELEHNIHLEAFNLVFGPSKEITELGFTIGLSLKDWVIIEEVLSISNPAIHVSILFPFSSDYRIITTCISGVIEFELNENGASNKKLALDVEAQLSDDFQIIAQLDIGDDHKGFSIADLVKCLKMDLPSVPNIVLDELFFSADTSGRFLLEVGTDNEWDILNNGWFLSESLHFALKHEPDGFSGSIALTTKILKTVDITLYASYANQGWQFEGSTGRGQKIPIGDLISDLGNKFGQFDPPESLQTLSIENLAISFNTQSKDFKFTSEVEFRPGSEPLDLVLTIEMKSQQDGSYSKHFSGVITLGKGTADEMDFDVVFDSDPKATIFIAAYKNPKGQSIKIQDLVNQVSPNINVGSLAFTIENAMLAYLSESGAGNSAENINAEKSVAETADGAAGENKATTPTAEDTSAKFLFGIDIDGGLNLSDLKLPDLPLVGPIFPPDQTLKLSFKLLAAKGIFSLDNVSKLNGLLAGGPQLPNKEINAALDLATILQIGKESKTLDLQVGVNKPPDGQLPQKTESPKIKETPDSASETPKNTGLVTTDPQKPNPSVATSTAPSAANAQSADGMQWIVLQKSFGPVAFERIGLAFKDSNITGALDASLMAGGLTIALNGLSVTSPITKFDPKFDLHGLSIDYKNGGLEIGGAFLKQQMTDPADPKGQPYTAFGGMAVIRTEKLTISAIGSYAKYRGEPSLFIYAILDYPLGGPAFFYVTGLAAGFGYNRDLKIPTIDTLNKFPLIADALKSSAPQQPSASALPAGGQQPQDQSDLAAKLASLESYIPPTVGEHFLAIGIKFTTFKIVESFALLTVKFGNKLEFDLLGLSTLVSPPPEAGKSIPPVAKATLALKATFIPDDGIFSLQAQLTSDSFILSQACHLTGGFAFFSWFKDNGDIKAGDFVLTLGGYHPKYNIPTHYPKVPALGINWVVNQPGDPYELSIKGDAYFALTPQALMAGGHLEVLWHMDSLRAWLKAGADFLIYWKPYHYDASMYVDIGASYTFELLGSHTITVDVGANLHLWGPEFAGTAELHIYIFSLTVEFGDQGKPKPAPIDWNTFKASFLPTEDQVCTVAVQCGLIRQVEETTTTGVKSTRWIVNSKDLVIVTNSVIPSKQSNVGNIQWSELLKENPIYVAPMGIDKPDALSSTHTITITKKVMQNGVSKSLLVENQFSYLPVLKTVPAALWDQPQMDGGNFKPLDVNAGHQFVADTVAGFEVRPANLPKVGATHTIERNKFAYELETIADAYKFAPEEDFAFDYIQGAAAWNKAHDDLTNIKSKDVLTARANLLSALGFSTRVLDFGESVKKDVLIQGVSA